MTDVVCASCCIVQRSGPFHSGFALRARVMASALAGCSAVRFAPSPVAHSRRAAHCAPRRASRSCRCSAEPASAAAVTTHAAPLARRKALLSAAAGAALCALPAAAPLQAAAEADGLPEVTEKFFIDITGAARARELPRYPRCANRADAPRNRLAVDGEEAGRVVSGVFGRGPTPLAAQRFAQIASGAGGVSYRRTNIDAVREGASRFAYLATLRAAERPPGAQLTCVTLACVCSATRTRKTARRCR